MGDFLADLDLQLEECNYMDLVERKSLKNLTVFSPNLSFFMN